LLDEPFASLDRESAARMVYILKKISQPFVLVSHNDKLSQKVINKSYSI